MKNCGWIVSKNAHASVNTGVESVTGSWARNHGVRSVCVPGDSHQWLGIMILKENLRVNEKNRQNNFHSNFLRTKKKSPSTIISADGLRAGEQGFEPRFYGPEPYVLPLDDSPVLDTGRSMLDDGYLFLVTSIKHQFLHRHTLSLSNDARRFLQPCNNFFLTQQNHDFK